jgi:hypothetical protein
LAEYLNQFLMENDISHSIARFWTPTDYKRKKNMLKLISLLFIMLAALVAW